LALLIQELHLLTYPVVYTMNSKFILTGFVHWIRNPIAKEAEFTVLRDTFAFSIQKVNF
jgi:hypothetical protein